MQLLLINWVVIDVFIIIAVHTRWIMRTMTVLAVIATVLSIIPVVSMSTDKGTVKDTYWTYGKVSADNSEVYFSINIVVIETTGPNDTAVNDKYDWYVSEYSFLCACLPVPACPYNAVYSFIHGPISSSQITYACVCIYIYIYISRSNNNSIISHHCSLCAVR